MTKQGIRELPKSAEPIEFGVLMDFLRRAEAAGVRKGLKANEDDGSVRVVRDMGTPTMQAVPPVEQLQQLAQLRGIPWDPAYAERVVPYWASDERVDSHGDIVRQRWRFETFAKNPVLAFSHNWDEAGVGNAIDWQVRPRTDADYQGPALWLLQLFMTAEQWIWADSVFRQVKAGFLRAGSVGFKPGVMIDVKDDAERQALGLGRWGLILDDNELLEFSVCLMGANKGALAILAQEKARGGLSARDLVASREILRRSSIADDEWARQDDELRAMARTVFAADRELFVKHRDRGAAFAPPEPPRPRLLYRPPERQKAEGDEEAPPAAEDVSARIAALEGQVTALGDQLAQMQAAVMETLTGISVAIEDVRGLLEDGDDPEEVPEEEGATAPKRMPRAGKGKGGEPGGAGDGDGWAALLSAIPDSLLDVVGAAKG